MTGDAIGGQAAAAPAPDDGVSRVRLVALRALYAFIVLGQALFIWPAFLARLPDPAHYHGVAMTMLAAFSILCVLGIRYPLQMLPVLLWELLWKAMWLLLIALPRWAGGTMDAATARTAAESAAVVLALLAVPWGYVLRNYVKKPAERPLRRAAAAGRA
jgi:hypothetical protein